MDFAPQHLMGWVPDHPDRARVASRFPTLRQCAPHLFGAANDGDVLLYKAWKDVLGHYPDYPAQTIGDCESFGNGHGTDLLECIQISLTGAAQSFKETSTEALYAMGREAGNMLGWVDGCYGSAMAQALTTMGVVPREVVGPYDGQRAKQWGHDGAPANVKQAAAGHKLGAAALVSTLAELDAALSNGYPVPVSSNQGFTMTRDADGFCRASGSWSHCMLIAARRTTGRAGYLICQSWGSQTPDGPLALDQPPFSFWAEPQTVASMLAGQDSFSLSTFNGYPGQPLPGHWTSLGDVFF